MTETSQITFDHELAQWRFGGRLPGPAGVARLVVDDVVLVVDMVDPSTIIEVTVDLPDCAPPAAPSDHARAFVRDLLGERAAEQLVVRHEETPFEPTACDVAPERSAVRALAGRLALLGELRALDGGGSTWWDVEEACLRATLAEEGAPSLAGRAEQATDAAAFVADFAARPAEQLTGEQRQRLVRRRAALARLVHARDPELSDRLARLEGPHLVAADEVDSTFEALTADLPDQHERTPELAGRLQRGDWTLLGGERQERGEGDPTAPVAYVVVHDDELAPGVVAPGAYIEIRWYKDRDEMRASIPLRPGTGEADIVGLWARVHRRSSTSPPVLVDMSLVTIDPGRQAHASARLLVPAGFSAGQLLVDVTLRPSDPPLTPASRARHRAVQLGLAAAREERCGSPVTHSRWVACSDAWIAAGDHGRAVLALERAALSARDEPAAARLHEEARRHLSEPDARWAEEYLGRLGAVPQPFDQEVFEPPPS